VCFLPSEVAPHDAPVSHATAKVDQQRNKILGHQLLSVELLGLSATALSHDEIYLVAWSETEARLAQCLKHRHWKFGFLQVPPRQVFFQSITRIIGPPHAPTLTHNSRPICSKMALWGL
jgi:hypothetical protein